MPPPDGNEIFRRFTDGLVKFSHKIWNDFEPCRLGVATKKTGFPRNGAIGDIFWEKEQRRSKRAFVR